MIAEWLFLRMFVVTRTQQKLKVIVSKIDFKGLESKDV